MDFDDRSTRIVQPQYVSLGAPRHPVAIPSLVSSTALGRREAYISDLSRLGCRIILQCKLPVGASIAVKLPSLEPLLSRVIWSDGEFCGVQFAKALGLPVLNMMADRHRRPGFVTF
jgi:hypothetical protein